MKQEAPYVNIERSIIKEYRKTIWRPFVKGLQEYEMIQDGDRVAVCISGGKDSMLLAKCLQQLKRQSDTKFELEFIVMDPGYQPENRKLIEENAALMNIPVRIFDSDILILWWMWISPPVTSAPECGGVTSIPMQRSWAAIRSHWDTILMM